jgi:hypothetical protein
VSDKHIPLDRADYYELSALGERIARMEAPIVPVRARVNAILQRLSAAHDFDPNGQFSMRDDGCVLIVPEKEPADGVRDEP